VLPRRSTVRSLASPVDANPNGAGPVAAGTKIIGVALYISATRAFHSAIYRQASSDNPASRALILEAAT